MVTQLRAEGFVTLPSEGTYFLNVDLTASGIAEDDESFCDRAVRECGVAAIPVSAFYDAEAATNVIRLCFAKQPATIATAVERLARARGSARKADPSSG
jgi:aspartate/methionine/tyrosine aminotransferase